MSEIIFKPRGVCSRKMYLSIDDDGIIQKVSVTGGCDGNLKGICSLIEGQNAVIAADKLRGITCGHKNTSCPDQLSKAIDLALLQNKQKQGVI